MPNESFRAQPASAPLSRLTTWLTNYWIWAVCLMLGLYVGLPWLAPIFMKVGWTRAGELIYLLYSTQCHQLPERSFFLFGPKTMLSLSEVQNAWKNTNNPLILRQFIGNPEIGWKVAWSDRMVYMYTSSILFALLFFGPRRKTLKPVPWWGFLLLLLPMVLDGITHFISDLNGIGAGFRDSNLWLAILTNHTFSDSFYIGDALGSFNSWMRLISGLLFGLGVVWFLFPHIQASFNQTTNPPETNFQVQ